MTQSETLHKLKLFTGRFKDEYEELGILGRGGFGEVFRARHLTDGIEYAVKRVLTEDGRRLEDILREVRSHAALKHQNIVVYNTSWLEEANCGRFLFIAMELGDETLEKWLREHPKEEDRDLKITKIWVQQLSGGLKYIHSKDMFHRDLKPSNILLFHDGDTTVPKISDFGLAKAARCKNGQQTGGVGTLQYMAPEQMGTTYDYHVDIYSLGLIFIEMIYPLSAVRTNSVCTARRRGMVPDFLMPKVGDSNDSKTLKKSLLEMTTENPRDRSFAWDILDDFLREKQTKKLSTVRFKDDYEELGVLGRGAFGVVVKARHLTDNTVYAVEKVEGEQEESLDEILREVRSQAALKHLNIVACKASWLEGKIGNPGICLYIVMEFSNETLEKWLEKHPKEKDRDLEKTKLWMEQLKEGLDYIHENHMFHRDLKPSNIVLVHSPEGTVLKISVSGLVKATQDKDSALILRHKGDMGTELYMAPELIREKKKYDNNKLVDIYSMGLIFIEMVYPMNPKDRKRAFEKRRNGGVPELLMPKEGDSDASKLLKETLLGITAIDTDERLHAWFHFHVLFEMALHDAFNRMGINTLSVKILLNSFPDP